MLYGEKSIFLRDIEAKTNSRITFPGDGLGMRLAPSPVFRVLKNFCRCRPHLWTRKPGTHRSGHASGMVLVLFALLFDLIFSQFLQDHVPFEADMHVPGHPELLRVATSQDFIAFSERMKREYQVAVIPLMNDQGLSPSSFKFKCQRSNSDCLITVRETLEIFLIGNHVHVYPSPHSHKRVDSFTDAFPHFNSKVLSTPMCELTDIRFRCYPG